MQDGHVVLNKSKDLKKVFRLRFVSFKTMFWTTAFILTDYTPDFICGMLYF